MKMNHRRFLGLLGLVVGAGIILTGCPKSASIVIFEDSALDAAVRDAIGKPFGFLTQEDCKELLALDARNMSITSLEGLENCTNLISLDLDTNNISDISPLSNLINLVYVNLDSNEITNIAPLAGLVNLDGLSLFDNQVGDISALVTNALNGGLGENDFVILDEDTLDEDALQDVELLEAAPPLGFGVNVILATGA